MGNAPEARPPADYVKQVITSLVNCLSCADRSVVLMALQSLAKLNEKVTFIENLKLMEDMGAVLAPIKDLIITGEWENEKEEVRILELCIGILLHFTQHEETGVDMILEANLLPSLMTLLGHADNEVRTKTIILVFSMIHKGSKEHIIPSVLNAKFMERVPELLSQVSTKMLKEYTINSLAVIMEEGTPEHYGMLVNGDYLPAFLPTVLQIYEQGDPEMKLDASHLIIKLWENGLKHGNSVEDLTGRLADYKVNENLVNNAQRFYEEERQAILFMKFAKVLGGFGGK